VSGDAPKGVRLHRIGVGRLPPGMDPADFVLLDLAQLIGRQLKKPFPRLAKPCLFC